MRSTKEKFTLEHTAIIDEWCHKYPRRQGIDMKRVKAEDWDRLEKLKSETGRNDHDIYCKAAYHRQNVIGDVPKKPSTLRTTKKAENYRCQVCGQGFETKQGFGGHMAKHKRNGETANHVTKSWVSEGAPITVTIPPAIVGQPLGDYMIVELNGSHRLAKLV